MLTGLGGEIPISVSFNGQQFALQPTTLKVTLLDPRAGAR